jgi:hypothetical protein
MKPMFIACLDELKKIAAKVPVLHSSARLKKVLGVRTGAATSAVDPNEARLHVAIKNRRTYPRTMPFGRQQRDRFGKPGDPFFMYKAKVDTKKGWAPRLTPEAEKAGHTVEDMKDLVSELDAPGSTKKSRGPTWRKLQKLTGTWINPDHTAKAKVLKTRKH